MFNLPKKSNGIVFFDIDDTLCNTSNFFQETLNNSLNVLLKEEPELKISFDTLKNMYISIYNKDKNGQNHYNLLLKSLGYQGEKVNQLETLLVKARHDFKFKNYKSFQNLDAIRLILKLKKNNFKLGIISDGIEHKQLEKLELLEIRKYFQKDLIFITQSHFNFQKNEFGYSKILNKISKKYNLNNIWIIGDREDKDIIPAKEKDFKTIRYIKGKYSQKFPNSQALLKVDNLESINIDVFLVFTKIQNKLINIQTNSKSNQIKLYTSYLLTHINKNDIYSLNKVLISQLQEIKNIQPNNINEELNSYFSNLQEIYMQLKVFNI